MLAILLFTLPNISKAEEVDTQVKAMMHTLALQLGEMSPYLYSDQAFNSVKGKEAVGTSLKILANRVKNPPPLIEKQPGFRITYNILADHIKKTDEVFRRGEMEYARMRLNSMGNLCASCHMQAPKVSHFSALGFIEDRNKETTYANADFLFVIRRYDEALNMYDKLAREYPKNGLTEDKLNDLYRRKLAILARVYRDPDKGIEDFKADLKNKQLPQKIRGNLEGWVNTLQKWKTEEQKPNQMKTSELLAYVNKTLPENLNRNMKLSDDQLFNMFRLSGLLYEKLYQEPKTENTQQILYELARCERSLGPLYWYSLSEIYLKECVMRFPNQSFSKKCYEAYRSGMEERYNNNLPEPVQQSIDALKEYVKN